MSAITSGSSSADPTNWYTPYIYSIPPVGELKIQISVLQEGYRLI